VEGEARHLRADSALYLEPHSECLFKPIKSGGRTHDELIQMAAAVADAVAVNGKVDHAYPVYAKRPTRYCCAFSGIARHSMSSTATFRANSPQMMANQNLAIHSALGEPFKLDWWGMWPTGGVAPQPEGAPLLTVEQVKQADYAALSENYGVTGGVLYMRAEEWGPVMEAW
jgi:hypothetical protein